MEKYYRQWEPTTAYWLDLDDTLILSVEKNIPFWLEAAEMAGLPPKSYDDWYIKWGGTAEELVKTVYDGAISDEKAAEVADLLRNAVNQERSPIPAVEGGPEIIKELRDFAGVGIVTSRAYGMFEDPERLRNPETEAPVFSLLAHRLLSSGYDPDSFDFVVASDIDGLAHKPDPKVFDIPRKLTAARGLDIRFVTYVGDHINDFMAAQNAGLNFWGVLSGTTNEDKFRNAGLSKYAILNDISEILDAENHFDINTEEDFACVRERLRESWGADTSSDPENWTDLNSAWGQCAVTACAIQRVFGGQLLKCYVPFDSLERPISHYFNRLPDGKIVDLTKQQFGTRPQIREPVVMSRTQYVLNAELGPLFAKSVARYERLVEKTGLQDFY